MRPRLVAAVASVFFAALASAVPAHAAFPGANGKIAFDRATSWLGPTGIWAADPDGRNASELTADGYAPAWSPDGRRIAFVRRMRDVCDANGCGEQPDLFVMNADGTGEMRLTATLTTEENPAWSADGRKIVFDTYDQGLFTINGDGSGRTRLTSAADTEPAWSPDGTKIAFVRGAGACGGGFYCNTLGDIYVMSADGTGQTRITGRDYVGEFSPNWSPDGTKIAMGYDTVENQEDGPSRFDIVVMNADGTGLVNVTDTALPDEFRPAWSPDGRQIAFDYEACSDSICPQDSVARITSDGSGRADITDPTVFATEPDWQPLPEPRRSNYRDAAKFCEADRQFLGAEAFQAKYGSNGNAANAFGNCVSANR